MLCSSHLAIISILLAASSSTPFIPRDDGALADLTEDLMEPVENFITPAVPRQVYTGHHGQADEQALATEAALPIPRARKLYDSDSEEYGAAHRRPRRPRQGPEIPEEPSPTILCPIPLQTVRVTVRSTITMVMNVATLWPRALTTPSELRARARAGGDDDDAPPIPTADLLLNRLEARGEGWNKQVLEGVVRNDEPQGGNDLLLYGPGGLATPPLVPALATAASTASHVASALPTASSSSSATGTTSSGVVAEVTPTALVQQACTTTMLGNLAKPCQAAGAGALTVYTSTVTVYSPVDCGACTSLRIIQPKWGCPFMSVTTEVTADCAYTWTSYLCSGATTPSDAAATPTDTASLEILATSSSLSSLAGSPTELTSSVAATDLI